MKKLKRISLISGVQILDAMSQKQLRGAGDSINCHSFTTKETCKGPCHDYDGHEGHCAWVNNYSCKCAVAFGEL